MASSSVLNPKQRLYWTLLLLSVSFFWGATFVLVKNAISIISPINFIQLRFIGTIVLSLITLRWFYQNLSIKELLFNKYGWFLGIFLYSSYFFQTIGLFYTTPSKAAFVTGLSIPLVPVFLLLFWRKNVPILSIFWSLIAFLGLAILTVEITEVISINVGDVIVLGTAISIAIHIIYLDKYSKLENDGSLILSQFLGMAVYSVFVFILIDYPINGFDFNEIFTFDVVFALLITIVFATIYAFSIQIFAQQRGVSAVLVALIFASEPIFALLTSLVLGEEILMINGLIGSMVIFIAIIGTILAQSKVEEKSIVEHHIIQ